MPWIVVQAAAGAQIGRTGALKVTVTGRTETGASVGPVVATPVVTVAG